MFQQKRARLTCITVTEKTCQEKPFVQVEVELTQAQLEAIAAGGIEIN